VNKCSQTRNHHHFHHHVIIFEESHNLFQPGVKVSCSAFFHSFAKLCWNSQSSCSEFSRLHNENLCLESWHGLVVAQMLNSVLIFCNHARLNLLVISYINALEYYYRIDFVLDHLIEFDYLSDYWNLIGHSKLSLNIS